MWLLLKLPIMLQAMRLRKTESDPSNHFHQRHYPIQLKLMLKTLLYHKASDDMDMCTHSQQDA